MAKYQVTGPDGQAYEVEAPEGATEQQIMQFVQQQTGQPSQSKSLGDRVGDVLGTPQEWGRALALTGRDLAMAPIEAASVFTEPVNYGISRLTGSEYVPSTQAYENLLTDAGVPEPETRAERIASGVNRLTTGMALGGGAEKVVRGAMGRTTSLPTPRGKPPTTEQLRASSRAAYGRAEDAGVVISPESFGQVVSRISDDVAKQGIDSTLHPRATAALQRLGQATDEPITLQNAETLRRVLQNAASSADASERRLAQRMIGRLDEYVTNLSADDVVEGSTAAGSSALREARSLWSRSAKASTVEDLMERARMRASQFSGSGYENALRTEFRQLVMNPKRLRVFTPEEQTALKRVAEGGTLENLMRTLGKFAPRGIVSTTLGGGAGYAVGGPVGSAAVMGAGEVGRRAATALTRRNATRAAETMRRGGNPAPRGIPTGATGAAAGAAGGTAAANISELADERRRQSLINALRLGPKERVLP